MSEITIPAKTGKLDSVSDRVVGIASGLGGSATKGVPDAGRVTILIDIPANRESEFRAAVASIRESGLPPATRSAEPGSSAFAKGTADKPTPATNDKKSFVVQIVEKE